MRKTLTDAAVRRLRPPTTGRLEVWDALVPGFGVRITERGHRSFVLMTRLRGKPIRVTLGAFPGTELAAARALARAALDQVARGVDPRAAKRAVEPEPVEGPEPVESLAVARVAARFIEKWSKPRNRTWREQERLLNKHVLPHWGERRLDSITPRDLRDLLDGLDVETKPVRANRVVSAVKKMSFWARWDAHLIQEDLLAGYRRPGIETKRKKFLHDDEVQRMWAAWDAMPAYPWGTLFKVLLLTGARRSEVTGMQWAELDLDAGLWIVPAARVKVKQEHVVPLSAPVVALLASVPRIADCPFVFRTRRKRAIRNLSAVVIDARTRSGVMGTTTHDLRRTLRTGLAALKVPLNVAERVLGHTIGGVVDVYDRHEYLDEKRDALDKWAAHLTKLVGAGVTDDG